MGPILLVPLAYLLAGQRLTRGGVNGGDDRGGVGGTSGGRVNVGGGDKNKKCWHPWQGHEGADIIQPSPSHPVPSGRGEIADPTGRDGPPHPARPRSLQELEPVWGMLGGLLA